MITAITLKLVAAKSCCSAQVDISQNAPVLFRVAVPFQVRRTVLPKDIGHFEPTSLHQFGSILATAAARRSMRVLVNSSFWIATCR